VQRKRDLAASRILTLMNARQMRRAMPAAEEVQRNSTLVIS
jgi:hypothetical protein